MEDGDGYMLSDGGIGNKCDTSTKQVFQSLKGKFDDSKSPEESTTDEDNYKLSNCYNNITKNVCAKESYGVKVKLNGEVGSCTDTPKCDALVIPDENSKSKSKGDRTSDIYAVDQVNDESGSSKVIVRKRKTCESPDSSSTQHDSLVTENMQNTSFKKRKFSHVSIPTQSVIPQAEAHLSKPVCEDSNTQQKNASVPTESQSSAVSNQQSTVPDPVELDTHLTGFAQYLGLQPIVKFRCFKCEETGFPSLLKLQEHQNACLKNLKVPLLPKPSQPNVSVDPSLSSTNFRISRKVFLCGSCGTYYENWNLFLHMREVHKRLICLYCLTMFSQIDMLSAHLTVKHGIVETVHSTPEDLLSDCKGSCFLMCCDCDAIFTERDDFANHICTERNSANTACQFCGLRGAHFPACPRAAAGNNTITTSASCSFSRTDAGSTTPESKNSPQITHRERGGASVTKYLIPVSSVKVPFKKTTVKKSHLLEDSREHSHELSDVDDDYDISNAASFCHVNIHEPVEKPIPVSEKTHVKLKSTDTPCTLGIQSTQVLSMTKPIISSTKLNTDTSLSTIDSLHQDDDDMLDNEPQSLGDSLLLNKLLEQKSDSCSHLANNTYIEKNTNGSKHLQSTDENDAPQQCIKTELNQSLNTCSSPQTAEIDTDSVSPSEKNDTCTSPPPSQLSCTPTSPKSELTCSTLSVSTNVVDSSSPTKEYVIDVKSPSRTYLVDVESSTRSDVTIVKSPSSIDVIDVKLPAITDIDVKSLANTDNIDDKLPTSADEIDVKSPASIDLIDVQSPTREDVIDVQSPTRADVIDLDSPARTDEIDVKSPASADEIDVKSPASADEIDVKSSARTDEIDVKSPGRTDEIDVKSPASTDGINIKSPAGTDNIDVKSPTRTDQIDITSPPRIDENQDKSPARTDVIDVKSPASSDVIDQSPARGNEIDVKSPVRADEIDVKSPASTDVIDQSPASTDMTDVKSPSTTDVIDSKSPTRTEWTDYSKSPLMTELEDSSTSSLRIELNNSSESTPSKELSDSKSPLGRELNNSPKTLPTINLKCAPKSPIPEFDSSKSPARTALLHDSSRTSSRASSVDNTLKSPSPTECHNNTQNSDSNSCPLPAAESSPRDELDDNSKSLQRSFSSDTPASPTLDEEYNAGSCSENGTKLITDIGIKLHISSNGTHVIIPKTVMSADVPPKKKGKGKSKSLPKKASLGAYVSTLPVEGCDVPSFSDLGKNEKKLSETPSVNVKTKRKKASKGAKKFNRKMSRTSKTDVESFSGSENNILDDALSKTEEMSEYIQIAGDEVSVMELHLEDDLEALTIQVVLQESVKTACMTCVYCNHAKKIAVNGKQLALHLLAEHKFIPVYTKCGNSSDMSFLSTDEFPSKKLLSSGELSTQVPIEESEKSCVKNKVLMDQYVNKLKMSLPNLQDLFLNTDTYDSSDRTFSHPYDRTYECFHCNFLTVLHKELYVHNRKMHQKTILLCIMCKSNFYSYSELLCHLCPGIYVPESNIKFRCHICSLDSLPSTFRLMVHLRKRHFVCDVCLETTDDQQKLSTHVWKHKLHHLCYRCGIAYRNKPDITKHLFWKHGTESVLCKKCLQKKWPHVYHFCIPPNAFVCEECNASFSRAVALKVHKRLHTGDLLHGCEECEERFISKRLLNKHQDKHREIPEPKDDQLSVAPDENMINIVKEEQTEHEPPIEKTATNQVHLTNHVESHVGSSVETSKEEALSVAPVAITSDKIKKAEKKVDVYDLPPLNLSSDSDDSEGEQDVKTQTTTSAPDSVDTSNPASTKSENVVTQVEEDTSQQPVPVVDGIWDNFQNYKANLERRESQSSENVITLNQLILPPLVIDRNVLTNVMLDHDYCVADEVKDVTVAEVLDQVPCSSVSLPFPSEQRVLTDVGEKNDNDKNNSFDHDYCFNKGGNVVVTEEENKETSEIIDPCVSSSYVNADASIKKQKSQKKKKRSASSSSSDSSSSSGSSSCSCGENCSCSSSSSSSGSSSDSSESDRSTSESKRRQIARKERREKVRRKKEEETTAQEAFAVNGTQDPEELNQTCGPSEPEDKEVPILESDLDTDETETDEDFYDQHPQLLANKLMAEKRNQLLLLAAVAPVNNLTPQPELATPSTSELSPQRKKVKSKKRKKRQHDAEKNSENKLKLNLSTNYYNYQTSHPDFHKPVIESSSFNPMHNFSQSSRHPPAPSLPNVVEPAGVSSAAESGSETDSKRLSKRRRMPKKFYGDSSDEDSSSHAKWSCKPQVAVTSTPIPCPPLTPPTIYKNLNPPPEPARVQPIVLPATEPEKSEEEDGAETESEQGDVKKSSSESSSESDGEKEMEIHTDSDIEPPLVVEASPLQPQAAKKSENLYCYCQCPYDEVSEMIACDGKDCTIEWFHFECVGIMVPPKGKWFCPDCKKNVPSKNPYFS